MTIKSSIATAGYRCEIGSLLHKGDIPREDAVVVARLRAAGALILGTTNCPEFLMAYETDNLLHGRTRNPWDLERIAGRIERRRIGGDCGGLSAAGLGSDSGGSVRVPAHFTGICSLKPTPGRDSGTRTSAAMRGTILDSRRDWADGAHHRRCCSAVSHARRPGSDSIRRAHRSRCASRASTICAQTTVGFFEDDGLVPVTQETRAAVNAAAQALREAGFRVEPFRPRTLEPLRKLWWKFFVQCGAMFYEPEIRGKQDQLSPIFNEFLWIADAVPPTHRDSNC